MIKKLFNEPKIISITADVNQGKSMLLYNIITKLKEQYTFTIYTYGLKALVKGAQEVYSVAEIENIRNSIIVIDELSSLFDLDNRKQKKIIENTLRLINHNNNVLILCGVPENFKKFLAGKIDVFLFKKCTLNDFINGSRIKNVLMAYKGEQRGSELLNMSIDEALLYDGKHYSTIKVNYLVDYDTKKYNKKIIVPKNVRKSVQKENSTIKELFNI